MTATTHHWLAGLEPDNFLAFMALLGLLRALETARPAWGARAYWDESRTPPRPVLTLTEPHEQMDIARAAADGVGEWGHALKDLARKAHALDRDERGPLRPVKRMTHLTRLKSTVRTLGEWAESKRRSGMFLFALTCEGIVRDKGAFHPSVLGTPLKFPSGQMAFVGTMTSLTEEPSPAAIHQSLFSPWQYNQKGNTLRFSPSEARRYALQAGAPEKEGAWCEGGATILSVLALPSYPLVAGRGYTELPAMRRSRRKTFFRWPLWKSKNDRGFSLRSIETLLLSPEIMQENVEIAWTSSAGIFCILEAERFSLIGQGDYYNISWGRQVTTQ